MKLVCHNGMTQIFADDENWIAKTEKNERIISRKEEPALPLACCLKWNFEPDDVDYLNNLSQELIRSYEGPSCDSSD